jgi:hypothetical protein
VSFVAAHPIARWLIPAGVAVVLVGGGALGRNLAADAAVQLPARSPAQLLADVATSQVSAFNGTVTERADLGLPALPDSIGGDGSAAFNSLLTGSHTLRVWYAGPSQVRVALLGALGESDLIRNGRDLWLWSSQGSAVTHEVLPTPAGGHQAPTALPTALPSGLLNRLPGGLPFALPSGFPYALPSGLPLHLPTGLPLHLPTDPVGVAQLALTALEPTTVVRTGPSIRVAGRDAYQLVVVPRDTGSLVAEIRIAIDAAKHLPLQVTVMAKGYASPAFQIGFTQIGFTRPASAIFAFTPPPGAHLNTGAPRSPGSPGTSPSVPTQAPKATVIGKGWTSVLVARPPAGMLSGLGAPGTGAAGSPTTGGTTGPGGGSAVPGGLGSYLQALPQASGSWGSGRVLTSRLISVLITDDGRVLIGAVPAGVLMVTAGQPAAALK